MQIYLPPTRSSRNVMSYTCLSSQLQSFTAVLLVLIFRATDGMRLSWHVWLITYQDGINQKTVTNLGTNGARDEVTSLILRMLLPVCHAATSSPLVWETRKSHWIRGTMYIRGKVMELMKSQWKLRIKNWFWRTALVGLYITLRYDCL